MLKEELNLFFNHHWGKFVFAGIVVVLAYLLTRLSRFLINRYIARQSNELGSDPTRFKFIRNSAGVFIFGLALMIILYSFPEGRTLAVSLFAGAGVFAAIIGFASQAAFSNIISGIFIVMFKPFRVNDWITVGEKERGIVEDITLRHTVIRDFQNQRIIIPNTVISESTILNSTIRDTRICRHWEIGISYDSDIDLARKIIQEEAMKHPLLEDNRTPSEKRNEEPVVLVRVMGFGESSINLRAYLWASDPENAFFMATALNESIKKRFDSEGIEIPFPYRTLVFKNKETYIKQEPDKN